MPAAPAAVNQYLEKGKGREDEADAQAFGTNLELVRQDRGFYMPAQKIEGAVDTATALTMAGLDFEVISEPVKDMRGRIIPGFKRNTRSDDLDVDYGIVTDRYKPIQNRDAFKVCDEFVANGYGWEAGGTTKHGGFAWGILAYQEDWKVAGEPMDKKLLFINSHKGDRSMTLGLTPLRPWCTNALPLSNGFGQARHRVQHTGDTGYKIEEAMALLGAAGDYFDAFGKVADKLAAGRVPMKRVEKWLAALYPAGTGDGAIVAPAEAKRELVRNALKADNLANHASATHANGWAFVNAVAELADWGSSRKREPMARLCGDSDTKVKNAALYVVMDDLKVSLN